MLWDRPPHTAAKHAIYRRYLDAWFPILLRSFPHGVTYLEGFAGPGEHSDGSPGSPIIAIRAARQSQTPPSPGAPVYLLLVEKDRRRLAHLKQLLGRELGNLDDPELLRARGFVVDAREGRCDDLVPQLLAAHQVATRPALAIFDTWGSGVPFALLQKIAAGPTSEVIVTIQPQQFTRFARDPQHYGDAVFGSAVWRDVQAVASDRKADYIQAQYRRTVADAGFRHVLDFELADEKSNLLYLVYGTNNLTGLARMKDALWAADPVQGVGYRDPRDPDQQMIPLVLQPDTAPLRRLILRHLEDQPEQSATLAQLREFTLVNTVYKPAHVTDAVRHLRAGGLVRPAGTHRLVPDSRITRSADPALF